jgi:mRNA-degrading endonuclease RelE of RelBE toxin-antitoxin system
MSVIPPFRQPAIHQTGARRQYVGRIPPIEAGLILREIWRQRYSDASGRPAEALTGATLRRVFDVETRIVRDEAHGTLLSGRAAKDLDRLDRSTQRRIVARLEEFAQNPYDPRDSMLLTNRGELRRSGIGHRRIIVVVGESSRNLAVVTIDHRGQVYRRV